MIQAAERTQVEAESKAEGVSRPSAFGVLALACVAVQAITGVMLAFVYRPTPDEAFVSTYYITHVMSYGWLVRAVHSWGADLTVIFAALHGVVTFITASYKRRPAEWVIGNLTILAAVAMGFTGNLLPWDQEAYWNTTATLSLVSEAPIIGKPLASLLLGGPTVSEVTLTRFHALHVTVLPAVLASLLVAHLWMGSIRAKTERGESVWSYAGRLLAGASVPLLLLASLLVVLVSFVPLALSVKADPSASIEAARPAWYFMSLYAVAQVVPAPVAAVVTGGLGVLFVALPLFDRTDSIEPSQRAFPLALGTLVIAGVGLATVAGLIS
ncbi:MAG: hypothetical protein Kow0056_10360 [Coriobacteriia bacterium]